MRSSWTEYLADPITGGALTLVAFDKQGDDVESGYLVEASGAWYPIVNGVPVFVPNALDLYPDFFQQYKDRLPISSEDKERTRNFRKKHGRIQDSFSYEWGRYHRFLLTYDSQYVFEPDLKPSDFAGKLVLDAGCGYGRHLKLIADIPDTRVVGIDLSLAVHKAREILKGYKNVLIIQADLHHPPLKPGIFDWVYSWGVLHHTPDTRRAFEGLVKFSKVGGGISIKVYQNWFTPAHVAQQLIRRVTCRLPRGLLYWLCYAAVPVNSFYQVLGRHVPGLDELIRFFIKPNPDWRICHTDTFDWWHPFYNHYHKHVEVIRWFEELEIGGIHTYKPNNVVRGNVTLNSASIAAQHLAVNTPGSKWL
ncbi:MAG: class I SAM-dependent methyltransferase [Ignavibacteriales bacterium]|nr:class I SAM-dependent methyltransferase [Ignavibacteriales bacterium]